MCLAKKQRNPLVLPAETFMKNLINKVEDLRNSGLVKSSTEYQRSLFMEALEE